MFIESRYFVLHRDTDDDIQMGEFALQNNVPLGFADLGLLATVGLQTIHVYDKLRVGVLSTDSEKIRDSNKIMIMRFNQPIDYLNPRPEYIFVIIEWLTKSSVSIARIISADIQCSLRLISARYCKGLDIYGQQVD
ncbi:unnamed protein product [Rotaria magnacalcarata]|uniref:Uncharacterized protein n=3 Tax=Rotaria magnacalcarata TaxID=392030 RepID=A0A816YWZ3_9BILA|nr:unnamed protein product [Rotaria magnacalcarata]